MVLVDKVFLPSRNQSDPSKGTLIVCVAVPKSSCGEEAMSRCNLGGSVGEIAHPHEGGAL